MKNKISKKQFLADVAQKNDIPVKDITKAYDALTEGIHDIVMNGTILSLTGFGSFYLQKHKGHPVQFERRSAVPDYVVFKFSASDVLNKRFRDEDNQGLIKNVGK